MSACRGNACNEGRKPCPCPQACELPDVWDRPIVINWQKLAIFCAVLLVILWAVILWAVVWPH